MCEKHKSRSASTSMPFEQDLHYSIFVIADQEVNSTWMFQVIWIHIGHTCNKTVYIYIYTV